MFKLLRFYSVTSFIIIFATAVLLTLFYRQVTMHWIEHLSERDNLTLAQTVLNSIKPEIDVYLNNEADASNSDGHWQRPSVGFTAGMLRMTQNTPVESIKIYNQVGRVFYSTQPDQIGANESNDPGFLSASNGNFFSSMNYRDIFNRFKGATENDNLMHTYIPIRKAPAGPIQGVLEIHTDMNYLIQKSDRALLLIPAGAAIILAFLYAALFCVVRHAKNIIEAQQKTIRERAESLETLSRQLLDSDEFKNKKIAIELHEGLAQTLSAIKVKEESRNNRRKTNDANTQPQESIVPVLQSAIHEVRTIATDLWPSSLDDLGLLPTINWFCREFERQYPEIHIWREISLPENMIPPSLKIVIYRIVESAFKNIAKRSNAGQIRFMLHLADDMIHLVIGDTPVEQPAMAAIARIDPALDPHTRFAEVKERTNLSGGSFSATLEYSGETTLHASWTCGAQPCT